MNRLADLSRFYALLAQLDRSIGGTRTLASLGNFRDWPRRGVYFFFEGSEIRHESGEGPRVVRVGTHALSAQSQSTLRQRLGQHRGNGSGSGNHRGSIFRLLIGDALLNRGSLPFCSSWGVKGDVSTASTTIGIDRASLIRGEMPVEQAVTSYITEMPFLWLDADDVPGPKSIRGLIEKNAIALLTNLEREPLDPPSLAWLGHSSSRSLVRQSGLWNQRHVDATYDPRFLDTFEKLVGH